MEVCPCNSWIFPTKTDGMRPSCAGFQTEKLKKKSDPYNRSIHLDFRRHAEALRDALRWCVMRCSCALEVLFPGGYARVA
jgi:hypothetical protein